MISKIFDSLKLVGVIIVALLLITIVVLSFVIAFQNQEITRLKLEKNMVGQTVENYKKEMVKKDEILKTQKEILDEIKALDPNKDWRKYIEIWKRINNMK